jgi:hypothetical protein
MDLASVDTAFVLMESHSFNKEGSSGLIQGARRGKLNKGQAKGVQRFKLGIWPAAFRPWRTSASAICSGRRSVGAMQAMCPAFKVPEKAR